MQGNWATVQAMFPGAQIVASTLDNFTEVIQRVRASLPVCDQDLGDSWVMGAPSDPIKMQEARALYRLAAACVATGTCTNSDSKFYNFSRQLLKNGEHTFGLHVQSYGPWQAVGYPNADFHQKVPRDSCCR